MTRVKNNIIKTRKNVLRMTKGYRLGRANKEKLANEAIFHAGTYAFAHRSRQRAILEDCGTTRINAATRTFSVSYSKFIGMLKKKISN